MKNSIITFHIYLFVHLSELYIGVIFPISNTTSIITPPLPKSDNN